MSALTADREAGMATLTRFVQAMFASVPPDVRRFLDIDAR
ncbi:hypothetical protein F4693_002141 [Sphingomonas endophytica]|uniref:Globin n=1 Tax=Sphingomonas endophytica TaxID=869719 RepID=A0A7X0JCL4_9SPHN|nr:hypothetical protein [Sphingomonas endophytica]